jgi:hypothetical protein
MATPPTKATSSMPARQNVTNQMRSMVVDVLKTTTHVPRLVYGTVATVTPPTLTLTPSGTSTSVSAKYLASYSPAVGDVVVACRVLTDLWVLNTFAGGGPWTSYTPTWSGTLGNGTLVGKYCKFGRAVHVRIELVIGSTSTIGGGTTWTFTLPFATSNDGTEQDIVCRTALGGTTNLGGVAFVAANSTTVIPLFPVDTTHSNLGGVVGNPGSVFLVGGNYFVIQGTYEAAS